MKWVIRAILAAVAAAIVPIGPAQPLAGRVHLLHTAASGGQIMAVSEVTANPTVWWHLTGQVLIIPGMHTPHSHDPDDPEQQVWVDQHTATAAHIIETVFQQPTLRIEFDTAVAGTPAADWIYHPFPLDYQLPAGAVGGTITGPARLEALPPTPYPFNGRSGGLAAALSVLTERAAAAGGDQTGGMRIAATGGIDATGTVYPVHGLIHKIGAAADADADVIFVPHTAATAAGAHHHLKKAAMQVVPVRSVADAVHWLCFYGATGWCTQATHIVTSRP